MLIRKDEHIRTDVEKEGRGTERGEKGRRLIGLSYNERILLGL
jgi:hypothetical protein